MQSRRSRILFAAPCVALFAPLVHAQSAPSAGTAPSGVGTVGTVTVVPAASGQAVPGQVGTTGQVVAPQGAPPPMNVPVSGNATPGNATAGNATIGPSGSSGTAVNSATPGTLPFPARPTDAVSAAFPNNAPFPALPSGTATPTQNTGTLGRGTTGTTTQTPSEVVAGSQSLGAITARDNAQLQGSRTAAETARLGGFGTTSDNALSAQARLEAQFDNAPSSVTTDAAGANPIYGMPLPGQTPSSQNPANTGPVPGSVVGSTPPAQTFIVTTIDPFVTVGTVTTNASATNSAQPGQAATNGRAVTGAAPTSASSRTPTAATEATPSVPATRIFTYGPGGGDNLAGQLRLYELNGQFRFSQPARAATTKGATAARDVNRAAGR